MASNFHMFTHKTTDTLYIKLTGDFDGSSASELANVLESKQKDYYQIFINTSELKNIYPFGVEVLQHKLLEIENHKPHVIFIGKEGRYVKPSVKTEK
jgi:ABC-type transporter Mla MlaB component